MLSESVLKRLMSWSVANLLYSLHVILSEWSTAYRQCPAYGVQAEFLDTAEAEFAGLVEQNAAVAAQLAAAEETGEVARAQYLRLTADFDNFRKRTV